MHRNAPKGDTGNNHSVVHGDCLARASGKVLTFSPFVRPVLLDLFFSRMSGCPVWKKKKKKEEEQGQRDRKEIKKRKINGCGKRKEGRSGNVA